MKHFKLFFILFVLSFVAASAQNVDTISVWSESMKKDIKNVVITPASYKKSKDKNYPVVYVLHGAGGNYSNWIKKAEFLPQLASAYDMIIVCADGNTHSWYWDSPIDPTSRYETYITKELLYHIDKNYRTITQRNGRAITGLSMGGHGALFLGFRHQDLYGACAAMSGGVDIESFPASWYMEKVLGTYAQNPERWNSHTVMGQLHLLKPNSIKILIDCGRDDFFYEVNENLHNRLLYRNIPHEYTSRPGVHDWAYWTNSIKHHLLFFDTYFNTPVKK